MAKNIYQKIADVMNEVKYVQKTGYNAFHKYKYAKEGDYIDGLRPVMLKHGLVVFPSTKSVTQIGEMTNVEVEYTLVNTDNPEEKVISLVPGSGSDKGDKGVYKALTGSKKYWMSMTFLIETGDDAEADEDTDKRAAGKPNLQAITATATTTTASPATPTASQGFKPKKAAAPAAAAKDEMDF